MLVINNQLSFADCDYVDSDVVDVTVVAFLRSSLGTAQLSLSTPTGGVGCSGDQVILVCTHPVLPQEPEYLQTEASWRRDGKAISSVGLGRSNPSPTTTRLRFAITEDTTGNYTCFLVNLVQSRTDESNSISVRPLSESLRPV